MIDYRPHSPELRDFVAGWEDLRLVAYAATERERARGIWTIGYGCTEGVQEGDRCTREMAEAWLDGALEVRGQQLVRWMSREPTQQQFDALLALGYNVGIDGAQGLGPSRTLALFNEGLDQRCADRFLLWNKQDGVVMRGLTKRRMAERSIYLGGYYGGRP